MSKQNKSQVGNRIILNGTALLLLAYMLAKIVQAYIVGGADAPGIKVLLLGIVVLGGIVFVVRYLVLLLKEYYRKPEDSPEKEQ